MGCESRMNKAILGSALRPPLHPRHWCVQSITKFLFSFRLFSPFRLCRFLLVAPPHQYVNLTRPVAPPPPRCLVRPGVFLKLYQGFYLSSECRLVEAPLTVNSEQHSPSAHLSVFCPTPPPPRALGDGSDVCTLASGRSDYCRESERRKTMLPQLNLFKAETCLPGTNTVFPPLCFSKYC